MQEVKRIFTNRRWMAVVLLFLFANTFLYYRSQMDLVGGSIADYAKYTNKFQEELSSLPSREAGRVWIREQEEEAEGWDVTKHSQKEAIIRWRERLEYQLGYSGNIDYVMEQSAAIQSNPFFAKPGSFEFRNAKKTAVDFSAIKDVDLELCAGDVVTSVIDYQSNTIFFIFFIFITVLFLMQPIKKGVEPLLLTAANGREALSFWRILIVAISAVICVSGSTICQLMTGSLLYQQPIGWSLPAQNIIVLQNWTVGGTVLDFLLWFVFAQILGIFVMGIFLWVVLLRFRSLSAGVFACILFLGAEYWLYGSFAINDAGYWLSAYNIFHLLSVKSVASRYLNYNIFGFPVNEKTVIIVALIIMTLVLIPLFFLWRRQEHGKSCAAITILERKGRALKSYIQKRPMLLTLYEFKKALVFAGGALFLLSGMYLLSRNTLDYMPSNQHEELYAEFVDFYAGEVTEEKLLDIQKNEQDAKNEYKQQVTSGAEHYVVSYYDARYRALAALVVRYQDLLSLKLQGIKGISLVNESAYERVYGEFGRAFRVRAAFLIISILCMLIPLVFSMEEKNNMKQVLFSACLGRKALWKKKQKVIFSLVLLIWGVWFAHDIYLYGNTGNEADLLLVNAQSFSAYSGHQDTYSAFWYVACAMLVRLFILLTVGALICVVSSMCRGYLWAMGISAMLLLGPFLLGELGAALMGTISCINWLTQSAQIYASEYRLSAMLGVSGCLILVFTLLSGRIWKKASHIAFD